MTYKETRALLAFNHQALCRAVVDHDMPQFLMLSTQVDLNTEVMQGPLVLVVRHHRHDMLKILIESSGDHLRHTWIFTPAVLEAVERKDEKALGIMKPVVDWDKAFTLAAGLGKADLMEDLIRRGADLSVCGAQALEKARVEGHWRFAAQWLPRLPREQPAAAVTGYALLISALLDDDLIQAKALLPYADQPGVSQPDAAVSALRHMAELGNAGAVSWLIPCVEDALKHLEGYGRQAPYDVALIAAAGKGHERLVHQLLHRADPNAQKGNALVQALRGGHMTVAEVLAPITDLAAVRNTLIALGHRNSRRWDLVNQLAVLAPPAIRDKWFAKDPVRFAETIAKERARRSLVDVFPANVPKRIRHRP
jgi:hypothetical protein